MKDDNVLVNANTNTGTSRELKLSFTIEHMTLLLMVYDGMRQIENNLLQITGNLDNTDPESALGKLAMIDSLLEQLSPLYSSITPSGKKMSSLVRSTSLNMCDQSNVVDSVPFTKDHMIILLTVHDGMIQFQDEIRAVVNCLTSGEEGSALWKVKKIYDLFNSLSPLYNALLSSGKIIRELDWDDPENIYALALDDHGGDLERRAKILMGDID